MQTQKHCLEDIHMTYPLALIAPPGQILFIDIETTGFSAGSSYLYMIGCLYYAQDSFHTIQWFADAYDEESQIINSFFRFSEPFKYLVHYNGAGFDLPYLTKKIEKYRLPYRLETFESVDIYRRIVPYKQILALENLKQKSIEAYLSLDRKDLYNGGQLISIYHEYVKAPTGYNCELLLLHNFDDLKGMLQILPILAYDDLFHTPVRFEKAVLNEYEDIQGNHHHELLLTCSAAHPLPVNISYQKNDCRIMGDACQIKLWIPLLHTELKYYLPDYKDYFYLPIEDSAIHKSVAAYVDHAHRIPATAATCYIKKEADFLPQWEDCFTPAFKTELRSKYSYFCFEDTLLNDETTLTAYANHLLQMFVG